LIRNLLVALSGLPANGVRRDGPRYGILAAILTAAAPLSPVAAESVTFVSNLGNTTADKLSFLHAGRARYVQPFTTGNDPDGYELDSVDLEMSSHSTSEPYWVRLYTFGTDGDPVPTANELLTFANPSSSASSGVFTFTVPSSVSDQAKTLSPNTTYAVSVQFTNQARIGDAASIYSTGGGESTALENWRIGDSHHYKSINRDWPKRSGAIRLAVNARSLGTTVTLRSRSSVPRGENAIGTVQIYGTVVPAASEAFSVDVQVTPVAPAIDSDFTLGDDSVPVSTRTTLNFAVGATASTAPDIPLTVHDDEVNTGDRSLTVTGTNTVGAGVIPMVIAIEDDDTTPAAPTGLTADPTHNSVILDWDRTAMSLAAGLEYRMRTGTDGAFGDWTAIPQSTASGTNATEFEVTGLESSVRYDFKLRARVGTTASAEIEAGADTFEPFTGRIAQMLPFQGTDLQRRPREGTLILEFSDDLYRTQFMHGGPGSPLQYTNVHLPRTQTSPIYGTRRMPKLQILPVNNVRHVGIRVKAPREKVRCTRHEAGSNSKICSHDLRPLVEGFGATMREKVMVQLKLDDSDIDENGGVARVTARLNKAGYYALGATSVVPFHVDISVTPESDADGDDFTLTNTRLGFYAHQRDSRGTVKITARNNDMRDGPRHFKVNATATVHHVVSAGSVTLTIEDDETGGVAVPESLGVNPAHDSLVLSWEAGDNAGVDHSYDYRLQKGDEAFGDWTVIPDSGPGQANHAGYTVSGLDPATRYTVELRARMGQTTGEATTESDTTLRPFTATFGGSRPGQAFHQPAPAYFTPGEPFYLETVFERRLRTAYMLSVDTENLIVEGGSHTRTQRRVPMKHTRFVLTLQPDEGATSMRVTLVAGTPPHTRCGPSEITRLCSNEFHPLTESASHTLQVLTAPAKPRNLSADATVARRVALSWDAPDGTPPASKRQYKHKVGDGSYGEEWTDIEDSADGGRNGTGFEFTDLAPNVVHGFQVRAVNSQGESEPAEVSATVQSSDTLTLNVDAIATDNRINIAEKASGFRIAGDTGTEAGVSVTVVVGTATLTDTSADENSDGTATWSVSVPADASYISGTSVNVTVNAAKTGFISPGAVERALTVDLSAPEAPAYTAPASLKVGVAITPMSPSGATGVDEYHATGLPSGLGIDSSTGTISGTPDRANGSTTVARVTVRDTADNTDTVDITFPAVAKGDQALSGFAYSSSAVTFGATAPTVTAPTGTRTTLSYSAGPGTVCTVDADTGALTLVGVGSCEVTATAAGTADWNEATDTYTVTVGATGALVLNLGTIATDDAINVAEKAAGFRIGGDTGTEAGVSVTVVVGTATLTDTSADGNGDGTATWSVMVPPDASYISGTSVDVEVNASKTGFSSPGAVTRALTVDLSPPEAPAYTAPASLQVGVAVTAMSPLGGTGIDDYRADGLPSGLGIDPSTGVIGGTPDRANANTAEATVTVSDTAGNTDTVDVAFPAVAKGDQPLSGFAYSSSSVALDSTAPTVTAPTGTRTTLSYSAAPATVCTVDPDTGALTLVGAGSCEITATAAGTADWNEATDTVEVTVVPPGTLVLNMDAIATDDTINIAEKAAGFRIAGDTGTETGVSVTVVIGTATLTDTSEDQDNAGTATWSVSVPPGASYITGTSVDVEANASKTGLTSPGTVTRALTVDLNAPEAPAYTAPASLQVGVAITAMRPLGGTGIDEYRATGLPAGLSIDSSTGVVGGIPHRADASTAVARITVRDTAGNKDTVDITFPAVAKGDQTLSGFAYSSSSVTFGSTPPTVTAPTGTATALSYSASPSTVCTVDAFTGALTLVGVGNCRITVTAAGTADWNEATDTVRVTVAASGTVVLTSSPSTVPEYGGAATVTLRARLEGPLLADDTIVTVSVGARDDTAGEGTDYATVDDVALTIPAGRRRARATFDLNPIDDRIDEADESLTLSAPTDGGLVVNATSVTITDDDERGVAVSVSDLTVPEGDGSTYTIVLESVPTDDVVVTPSVNGDSAVTVSPAILTFTPENWCDAQTVTVSASEDSDAEDGAATVEHAVSGADYGAEDAASVAVTVTDRGQASRAVLLSVEPGRVAEDAGATELAVTARLDRAPRSRATVVTVSLGATTDAAVAGTDYASVDDFTLTIAEGETSARATFTFEPGDDGLSERDEAISVTGTTDAADLDCLRSKLPEPLCLFAVDGTAITIRDDDTANNAPVFAPNLPGTLEVAENTTPETAIGPRLAASDVDGHALTYSLEGVDAHRFGIDRASGRLRTLAVLNRETQFRHTLTVVADDRHGARAEYPVIVIVTDADEQPGTPAQPTLLATAGSTTSLDVRWSAPEQQGGPPIAGYALQFREGTTGSWSDHRHIGNDTRATIAGLTAATEHQARVRALNGETPGAWSEPGSGRTGQTDNAAPVFESGLPTVLTVEENTAAGTDLGAPFRATDSDDDTLTWVLEGSDRQAFAITPETGQLQSLAALDHESKPAYSIRVRAYDGNGGASTLAVAVNVTDVDEQAGVPDAPVVLAAAGSTTRLEVNWETPETRGGPDVAGYAVQHRVASRSGESDEAAWIDHAHGGAGTRAVIPWLDSATTYQVRVRALNGEIAGEWSEPGSGSTGTPGNSPPAFDPDLPSTFTVDENTPADIGIGAPLTASDADGDTLTWLLDGTAASVFAIDPETGQLRTRAVLDHETKAEWNLGVRVSDGRGGANVIRVKVAVADLNEQAPSLNVPLALATASSTTSLDLRWSPPAPNGGPPITDYEVQYRASGDGEWIEHAQGGTNTTATISDLEPATTYEARVRALNGEIPGDWSEPATGTTGSANNTAPSFGTGLPTTLTVNENTPADTDIGSPYAAADADGDTLVYLLDHALQRLQPVEPV